MEYGRESPIPPPTTSPVKGEKTSAKKALKNTSRERGEKEDKSDKDSVESSSTIRSKGPVAATKDKEEKEKITFDLTKPHWTAKFVLDTGDNDFHCVHDLSVDEAFKSQLHQAVGADSAVLQRGREFRDDFIRRRESGPNFVVPESVDYPGWTSGSSGFINWLNITVWLRFSNNT